jgi:hypothetical protein
VAGYGVAGIVSIEAITASVPELMWLLHATHNAYEVSHLSTLVYRLVDPCWLANRPRAPLSLSV